MSRMYNSNPSSGRLIQPKFEGRFFLGDASNLQVDLEVDAQVLRYLKDPNPLLYFHIIAWLHLRETGKFPR